MMTDTSAYCSLLGVFSGSVLQFLRLEVYPSVP